MNASHPELLRLRESIDNLDAALIHLLAERFRCTQAVGQYKARHDLPPADPAREAAQIARLRQLADAAKLDPAREAAQIARLRHLADAAKLDPDFAEKFFNFVVREVIRHHEAIRQTGNQNGGKV